ncbi:MAG: hypothetical protein ACRDTZ_00140 [Pseudonocardiaceae bacterium]
MNSARKPGPEYLATCQQYGISSYAARTLTLLSRSHRIHGPELGSGTIETNLRNLGLIVTNDQWSGCVDITPRGSAMIDVLCCADQVDAAVREDDPEVRERYHELLASKAEMEHEGTL